MRSVEGPAGLKRSESRNIPLQLTFASLSSRDCSKASAPWPNQSAPTGVIASEATKHEVSTVTR